MSEENFYGPESNTYANIFTYMGFPLSRDLERADAVVMGVPYDLATTGRSGTRYGPAAIRQASAQVRWEERRWPWEFNLRETLNIIDYGDIAYEDGDSQEMSELVTEMATAVISAQKFLLTFGGDHYISLPLLRAAASQHDKLALLHFDAHTDTGTGKIEFNHGSMFRLALKEKLMLATHSVQVGIRTEYDTGSHPMTVLNADHVNDNNASAIVEKISTVTAGLPIYLSIDVDCLDPAFAPGTGTPVPGGVTTNKLLQIIRGLKGLNIVAADVMEVAPSYDHADLTALAAATLGLELLHVHAATRR